MGEYIYNRDHNGHGIRGFTPDDTDDKFYLEANYSGVDLVDILDKIQEKWPGLSLHDVTIEAEHIHTHCLGYDRYDPGDHTNYLCIERKKDWKEKITKTMYYVTRFEHNPDKETMYYVGRGLWQPGIMLTDTSADKVTGLRLYEAEEAAKAVIENLTEGDWHAIEIQK